MRRLVFVFSLLILPLRSQWLETRMYLPDSFSGIRSIYSTVWLQTNDQLYFSGPWAEKRLVGISCATDEKIQPFELENGLDPYSIIYNPNNNCLYGVVVSSICTLYSINTQNRQVVAKIPFPGFSSLTVNHIANKVYLVSSFGSTDSLYIIDCQVHQIRKSIGLNNLALGPHPIILNPHHNVAYILTPLKVYVLSGITDTILDSIEVFEDDYFPCRFALFDSLNDRLYIFGYEMRGQARKPNLAIINCLTNSVTARIILDTLAIGPGVDMAVATCNQMLYVLPISGYGERIWVIDPWQGIIVDSINTGYPLFGIKYCAMNNRLYAAAYDKILVINPISRQVEHIIDLGRGFHHNWNVFSVLWFLHPLRHKLYIPARNPYLVIIDCQTNLLTKKMAFGVFQAGGFLWNPLTNRLYCTDKAAPFVHCFDASTNRALYSRELPITPGSGLYELAVSTLHNKIYIGSPEGIIVMDGFADTVIKVIGFSPGVKHLCYNPTSDKIYGSRIPYTCIIDCVNDEIISVHFTLYAYHPFCNPRTNKVYMSGDFGMSCIIDGEGDTLLATFEGICGWVAFREIDELVYMSVAGYHNSLAIFDGRTNRVVQYLTNLGCGGIIYNPINDRLYCNNLSNPRDWDSTLVLDCVTNEVIDTIPIRLAVFHNPINNKLYGYANDKLVVVDGITNEIIARFDSVGICWGIPIWNSIQNRIYFDQGSHLAVLRDEIPGMEESRVVHPIPAFRQSLAIYPNPAKSYLAIRIPLSANCSTLKIFDVSGKLIREIAILVAESHNKQEREIRISLKGINPGIYFIQLGTEVKKFLVVK